MVIVWSWERQRWLIVQRGGVRGVAGEVGNVALGTEESVAQIQQRQRDREGGGERERERERE